MKWTCIIVLAPELRVAVALEQYMEAKRLCTISGDRSTMVYAFYINMGGFVLNLGGGPFSAHGTRAIRDEILDGELNSSGLGQDNTREKGPYLNLAYLRSEG